MRYFCRRSQSLLEYAVFFSVILAALLVMQFYVKRKYQGNIKDAVDELGRQYSPGHTTSVVNTTLVTNTTSYTGSSYSGISLEPGVTASVSHSSAATEKKEAVDSFVND
ncbi:MAG: hypothetical protein PHF11_04890 [Candidatus Omnitrophica bacterium]|nr:hypothetical protein [Candidatus Omnitrophota bacterium]